MAQYLLTLYGDPSTWVNLSPEEMQKAIGKFMSWGKRLREQGVILGSNKLKDEAGKVLRPRTGGKPHVVDGPYSETKEVLGGYYLIEARDYDHAVQLSSDCPNLEYGGTIEVRAIEQIPGA